MGTDLASRDSRVYLSTDGVTYTEVTGTKGNIDWPITGTPIETTDRDTSGWKEFGLTGRGELSCRFGGNYNEDDPGQLIMINAVYSQTNLYVRYRPAVGAGYLEYLANGSITNMSTMSPDDEACQFSCDMKLSTPTKQLQT